MSNTEPVPTPNLEADLLHILVAKKLPDGTLRAANLSLDDFLRVQALKKYFQRICASERLDELNMISCRYGVFVDFTLGYEVKTKAVSLKDIGKRVNELQTQLEGETK